MARLEDCRAFLVHQRAPGPRSIPVSPMNLISMQMSGMMVCICIADMVASSMVVGTERHKVQYCDTIVEADISMWVDPTSAVL